MLSAPFVALFISDPFDLAQDKFSIYPYEMEALPISRGERGFLFTTKGTESHEENQIINFFNRGFRGLRGFFWTQRAPRTQRNIHIYLDTD